MRRKSCKRHWQAPKVSPSRQSFEAGMRNNHPSFALITALWTHAGVSFRRNPSLHISPLNASTVIGFLDARSLCLSANTATMHTSLKARKDLRLWWIPAKSKTAFKVVRLEIHSPALPVFRLNLYPVFKVYDWEIFEGKEQILHTSVELLHDTEDKPQPTAYQRRN